MNASAKRLTTVRYPCDNAKIQMDLVDANPFWHPTMLIRRDALSVVGLYRSGIAEDYDLWLRIAERFQVANLEAVVLKYRVHPYQISVRSCRSQALGAIASQVAARARRSGEPDPLDESRKSPQRCSRSLAQASPFSIPLWRGNTFRVSAIWRARAKAHPL